MELLYVWIEEYNNIKRQGFNFSPKHHFHFEPNEKEGPVTGGTLTHNEINTSYPDNFFGEHISNITAIVGKNGSGKSSLIEFILNINELENNYGEIYVIIAKQDNNSPLQCYSSSKILIKHDKYIKHVKNRSFHLQNGIFHSFSINQNLQILTDPLLANVSNTYLLDSSGDTHSDFIEEEENILSSSIASFRYNEMKRQIKFICFLIKTNILIDDIIYHKLPNEISITIEFKLKNQIPFFNLKHTSNFETYTINPEDDNTSEIEKIIYYSLDSEWHDFAEEKFPYSIIKNEYDEIIKENEIKPYDISHNISKELISGFFKYSDASTQSNERPYKYNLTLNFNLNKNTGNIIEMLTSPTINTSHWLHKVSPLLKWRNMSDGETAYLSLLSRLHGHLIRNITSTLSCYNIILDEPDINIHPDWQQKFLSRLIHFFNIHHKKVNIIITTHSPIIVSDLPRENIIFLDKNASGECVVKEPKEMDRTFGANIHSLYRSSFFMDGLMGKFAEGKINDVIKDLRGNGEITEERKKEIRFIIDTIGEDVLRTGLEKLYEGRFPLTEKEKLEKEIEHHKKKQVEAESKLKALN